MPRSHRRARSSPQANAGKRGSSKIAIRKTGPICSSARRWRAGHPAFAPSVNSERFPSTLARHHRLQPDPSGSTLGVLVMPNVGIRVLILAIRRTKVLRGFQRQPHLFQRFSRNRRSELLEPKLLLEARNSRCARLAPFRELVVLLNVRRTPESVREKDPREP